MKKSKTQLKVKEGWDLAWNLNIEAKAQPIFIGRDSEVNRIKNFIRSGRQGALFIAGENGAGKTSTVLKTICDLKKDLHVLPLNYIFLDSNDNKVNTISLIKQLVRALYISFDKKDVGKIDDLEQLYQDVNATKLKKSDNEQTKTSWEYQLIAKDIVVSAISLLILLSGTISLGIASISSIFNTLQFDVFVPGLVQLGLGFIGLKYSKTWHESSEKLSEVEGLSIHELQIRTSKILKKLQEHTGKEVVIIFDELDHYDFPNVKNDGVQMDTKMLLQTLKGLKLLFQDVSATFIFLTGQKTYEEMKNNPYATIATDKFFLSKARPLELESFVISIFVNPNKEETEWLKTYASFKIKESDGNFYKLIALIRDDLEYLDDDTILNVREYSHIENVTSILIRTSYRFIDAFTQPLGKGEKNNDLFKNVMNAIDNFESYLGGVSSQLSVSPDNIIENAVTSYIDYVFDTVKKLDQNLTIPVFDKGKNMYTNLEWKSVQNLSEPDILINKVTGAILPEEKEVEKIYNEISADLGVLLQALGVVTTKSLLGDIRSISLKNNLPTTPISDYAKELSDAHETINSIPFQERPAIFRETLVNKVIPAGKSLKELVSSKYFTPNTRPLVVKRIDPINAYNSQDSFGSSLVFELGKRNHAGGMEFSSFATITHPLDQEKFSIKFSVYMQPDSIVNIVFGTKPWAEDPLQREFIMLRLDGRSGSKDGIFYKASGQPGWHEKAASKKGIHTKSHENVFFWVRLNNKEISLNKPRWNSIIAKERVQKIHWWGVANESGEVELTLFTDSLPEVKEETTNNV